MISTSVYYSCSVQIDNEVGARVKQSIVIDQLVGRFPSDETSDILVRDDDDNIDDNDKYDRENCSQSKSNVSVEEEKPVGCSQSESNNPFAEEKQDDKDQVHIAIMKTAEKCSPRCSARNVACEQIQTLKEDTSAKTSFAKQVQPLKTSTKSTNNTKPNRPTTRKTITKQNLSTQKAKAPVSRPKLEQSKLNNRLSTLSKPKGISKTFPSYSQLYDGQQKENRKPTRRFDNLYLHGKKHIAKRRELHQLQVANERARHLLFEKSLEKKRNSYRSNGSLEETTDRLYQLSMHKQRDGQLRRKAVLKARNTDSNIPIKHVT